jgi:hypothetical protein
MKTAIIEALLLVVVIATLSTASPLQRGAPKPPAEHQPPQRPAGPLQPGSQQGSEHHGEGPAGAPHINDTDGDRLHPTGVPPFQREYTKSDHEREMHPTGVPPHDGEHGERGGRQGNDQHRGDGPAGKPSDHTEGDRPHPTGVPRHQRQHTEDSSDDSDVHPTEVPPPSRRVPKRQFGGGPQRRH